MTGDPDTLGRLEFLALVERVEALEARTAFVESPLAAQARINEAWENRLKPLGRHDRAVGDAPFDLTQLSDGDLARVARETLGLAVGVLAVAARLPGGSLPREYREPHWASALLECLARLEKSEGQS